MVYLDHAATTPMLPEVLASMTPYFLDEPGNPSSLHASGRRARRAVEEAREAIAIALGARPSEVVFTGSGTEADNLAVKGIYWARRAADPARTRIVASSVEHHAVLDAVARRAADPARTRIVASSVEHHAVLDAVEWLVEHERATVTWLPVDSYGRVPVPALRDALGDDVALVTVMWANNEVGTVQPVRELAEVAAEAGVPFHSDAVQAIGQLPVDFAESGVDALTITGHKIGGPKGIGALLLRTGVACTPLLHGGGQERDVRSGTLDTPSIVGLATAVRLAVEQRVTNAARVAGLRDSLVKAVLEAVPDATLNGDPDHRLPSNAHVSFPGCEGDALLLLLDARGIECSTGSACTAGIARPSHVLTAMGLDEEVARGSLRFSLGHTSTESDVAAVADAIVPVVERARRAGVTSPRR